MKVCLAASLSGLLSLVFCSVLVAQGGNLVVVNYHKNYQEGEKTYPVQLVYTPNDEFIKLRICFDNEKWSNEKALEFLRTEVNFLVQSGQTEVGDGYSFVFTGTYPVWAPHRQFDGDGKSFQYLQFTNGGSVTGKKIVGNGTEKIIGKYYPYLD